MLAEVPFQQCLRLQGSGAVGFRGLGVQALGGSGGSGIAPSRAIANKPVAINPLPFI